MKVPRLRSTPWPRTVRAKLTLFTMLVTGVLLGLIVLVVDLGARRTLFGAVDGELLRLSRRLSNRPPRGPGGPDGRGPIGPPPGAATVPGSRGTLRRGGGDSRPEPDPAEIRPLDFPVDPPAGMTLPTPYDAVALSRARAGASVFSEFERNGSTYRLYTFPLRRDGRIEQVVQAPSDLTEVLRSLAVLRRTLLQIVLPIGVLFAGLASLLLVDRFMRPLRRISTEADRIGATDLAARLPVIGEDEFAGLSTTLNGMLSRLETAFQKERNELERQRGFTADASHELKTPLAVIKANAGLMLHVSGTPEETREWTGEIDAAANRMTRLVNDMLVLARAEAGAVRQFSPCDLRDVAAAARRSLGVGEDRLRLDLPSSPATVLGASDDLTRVVVNLAGNALKHSGATEPIEIAVAREDDRAILSVSDRGKGIAAEHVPHLFDRFYRVDASRSSETGGTGLGLAICRSLVEAHGGWISVQSRLGAGTVFQISLPRSASAEKLPPSNRSATVE